MTNQALTTMAFDNGIVPPGYRLPAATRVGTVRLQVADLARSLDYYQRVVGLRVVARGAGSALLAPQGSGAALAELVERAGAAPVPRSGRIGLYHFALRVPDRATLGRFVQHLAWLGVPAGMSDHLVSEAVYLTDPDGLGIEVYADRPRAGWRHSGRELVMQTEPLDAQDLIGAADDSEPWTGMPAGTEMGHIHLFVRDLDSAESFYHRGLGFDKVVWSYPGALFLSAGGYHHHLGVNTWAARAPLAGEADARLLEWTVVVPHAADADQAASSLGAAGYTVTGSSGNWVATDPWGTALRVRSEK